MTVDDGSPSIAAGDRTSDDFSDDEENIDIDI